MKNFNNIYKSYLKTIQSKDIIKEGLDTKDPVAYQKALDELCDKFGFTRVDPGDDTVSEDSCFWNSVIDDQALGLVVEPAGQYGYCLRACFSSGEIEGNCLSPALDEIKKAASIIISDFNDTLIEDAGTPEFENTYDVSDLSIYAMLLKLAQ